MERFDFNFEMETVLHPTMVFKSPTRPQIKLFVVQEDLEAALVQLGDKDYRGCVNIRLAVPYYGKETYAHSRMEGIVIDVEARTVSTAVITDSVETFSFSRRTFTTYLRTCLKEMKTIVEKNK